MARRNYVARGSPPSAYAIQALLEGQKGSVGSVMEVTLMRTLFLIPGLYLTTNLRGKRLMTVAFAGSASITIALMGYYVLRNNGVMDDNEDG